jgi:transposase
LFAARVRDLDLPEHLVAEITPLLAMFEPLKEQIDDVDAQLVEMARRDDRAKRLMTMPQIGPLTALSFLATLDEVVPPPASSPASLGTSKMSLVTGPPTIWS